MARIVCAQKRRKWQKYVVICTVSVIDIHGRRIRRWRERNAEMKWYDEN